MDTCGLAPFVEDSPIITVIENFGSSDESEACLDKLQQIFGQLLVGKAKKWQSLHKIKLVMMETH